MDKGLMKDVGKVICEHCPAILACRGDLLCEADEALSQIYAIFIKHNYGQKDENAEFPPVLTKVLPTIAQNMKDEGWHKDKLQVKLIHTETGQVSQEYITPDASERRM